MQANIATEEEETAFSIDEAETKGFHNASIDGAYDGGHFKSRFHCTTLTERVIGFMEKYE
jgi:hypothetical protein